MGEEWIEVEGACKSDSKSEMIINFSQGSQSGSGIESKTIGRLIQPLVALTFEGLSFPNSDVRLVGNTRKTEQVLF